MNGWLLASTSFLASAVEAVEALTIVLAVGMTRSWRSALAGTAWALVTLAAIVIIFGPAIVRYVPFAALEIVIGLLLLLFGLAWLRKAILRYSGRKALHDEAAIYAREVRALRGAPVTGTSDRLGFVTAYNAVLLEGLEVAVIVLTFGASSAAALRFAVLELPWRCSSSAAPASRCAGRCAACPRTCSSSSSASCSRRSARSGAARAWGSRGGAATGRCRSSSRRTSASRARRSRPRAGPAA